MITNLWCMRVPPPPVGSAENGFGTFFVSAEEEDASDRLMPCPENWQPHSGRGPACEDIEEGGIEQDGNEEKDLMPCPKKWDPRYGKSPACRPVDDSP